MRMDTEMSRFSEIPSREEGVTSREGWQEIFDLLDTKDGQSDGFIRKDTFLEWIDTLSFQVMMMTMMMMMMMMMMMTMMMMMMMMMVLIVMMIMIMMIMMMQWRHLLLFLALLSIFSCWRHMLSQFRMMTQPRYYSPE